MHLLKSSIITVRPINDVARMLQIVDCITILETVFTHIQAVIIFFTALKNCYSDPSSNVEVGFDHGMLGQMCSANSFGEKT